MISNPAMDSGELWLSTKSRSHLGNSKRTKAASKSHSLTGDSCGNVIPTSYVFISQTFSKIFEILRAIKVGYKVSVQRDLI